MPSAMTRPTPTPAADADRLSGHRTLRGLANKEVKAAVAETGSGPAVVFLHGLVGLNDHWDEVVQRTRAAARCVMLELPLLDLEGDDCSIHGATELTVRFLDQHLRQPAVLVGNSFGGHVATKIALERPDLCRGLVLAGASGLIEKSMVSDIQIRPSREWLQRKIGELFFDQSKMNPADVERAFQQLSLRGRARAMVKLSRSARRNHLGDQISAITTPTLLIWGRQDIVTPPEAADEFKAKIRDSRLVWFDQCGHAPMIECPQAFAHALTGFVGELEARSLAN